MWDLEIGEILLHLFQPEEILLLQMVRVLN